MVDEGVYEHMRGKRGGMCEEGKESDFGDWGIWGDVDGWVDWDDEDHRGIDDNDESHDGKGVGWCGISIHASC